MNCLRDCGAITHATGLETDSIDNCACDVDYIWESPLCVRECAGNYEVPISSVSACDCDSGFVWNATEQLCVIDCSGLAGTTGSRATDSSTGDFLQDVCVCEDHYYWDESLHQAVSCGSVQYTSRDSPPTTPNQCNCFAGFTW